MYSLAKKFLINEGVRLTLSDHPTNFSADYQKEDAGELLEAAKKELLDLQEKFYVNGKHALLIIFQAMDAAGKDSAIQHVMSGINPQGCQVHSFKQPSEEDYLHDFLWRHNKALPERSKFGIHNRSHYENVLVCKVHPELIAKENLPDFNLDALDDIFWEERYESIREFEEHLSKNGTVIIKFFLNVSKSEQKKRFLDRIDEPLKNWKFSSLDVNERALWDRYMSAYEDAISATTKPYAPWYIIPADKKWFSRIAISHVIIETLRSLNLEPHQLSNEDINMLNTSKKALLDEI